MKMKFKILEWLNKKGQVGMNKVNSLFGALVVVLFASALAPTMFESIDNLTLIDNAPAWLTVLLPLVLGIGIVFMIWRAIASGTSK